MKTAYIYPAGRTPKTANPYINDFTDSLSEYFYFINKSKFSKIGILDLYKYINKIDLVFFNWIEDIPDKRGGLFQGIILLFSIVLLKIKGIQIFYTLHNKESHYQKNTQLKKLIRKIILKNADFILCHSSEGINILNLENIKSKTLYIPHPFRQGISSVVIKEKKYDILIWGAIRPYKGIDAYLRFLASKDLLNAYKTIIVGQILPEEYEIELNTYQSESIKIINQYITDEALNELISQTKLVLFTYNENSVLSSGALIYTLTQGADIIGPNAGAFKDIYREGLIDVFDRYEELIEKIDFRLKSSSNNREKINNYIKENSWKKFGMKLSGWINS
jgi:glycosyltransferase involved in cell wall biosynthesis